ncbi:MAG: hypothetical protein IPN22_14920 [Bacteroidetes bacterium]|nr:hypothetical protein [Bacteroidota bacterium]
MVNRLAIISSLGDIKSFVEGFAEVVIQVMAENLTAGVVHKGELVIDKETTAAMGLRGADMADFKNGILSQSVRANIPDHKPMRTPDHSSRILAKKTGSGN